MKHSMNSIINIKGELTLAKSNCLTLALTFSANSLVRVIMLQNFSPSVRITTTLGNTLLIFCSFAST